jgi:hypothetical protein
MERPTCKTCPFFFQSSEYAEGECRINPPTVIVDQDEFGGTSKTEFPAAEPKMFCSRHPDFKKYLEASRPNIIPGKCHCGAMVDSSKIVKCRDCPVAVCPKCQAPYMTGMLCKECHAKMKNQREEFNRRYMEEKRANREQKKREARNAKRRARRAALKGKR